MGDVGCLVWGVKVFRVNFAPVTEFEEHVGTRTTYRVGTVDLQLRAMAFAFIQATPFTISLVACVPSTCGRDPLRYPEKEREAVC